MINLFQKFKRRRISKKIKAIVFFAVIILAGFGFADNVLAGYYTTGTLISTNLLSGEKDISNIDFFGYTASVIPAKTGLKVQFSQDNTNWYNSSGVKNGWNTLSVGSSSISLSALHWSGSNFYYKIVFTSDGSATPVLDEISVAFSSGPTPPYLIWADGTNIDNDSTYNSETTTLYLQAEVNHNNSGGVWRSDQEQYWLDVEYGDKDCEDYGYSPQCPYPANGDCQKQEWGVSEGYEGCYTEGQHSINCFGCWGGDCTPEAKCGYRIFFVDNTDPTADFTDPTPDNGTATNQTTGTIKISGVDYTKIIAKLYSNGNNYFEVDMSCTDPSGYSAPSTNPDFTHGFCHTSDIGGSSSCKYNCTYHYIWQDEGVYEYYVKVTDEAGNSYDTEKRTLAIDGSKPDSPTYNLEEGQYFKENPFLDIDFSDNIKLDKIEAKIDSEGHFFFIIAEDINESAYTDDWKIPDNVWNSLSDGIHYIYFRITDKAGNRYNTENDEDAFEFIKRGIVTFVGVQITLAEDPSGQSFCLPKETIVRIKNDSGETLSKSETTNQVCQWDWLWSGPTTLRDESSYILEIESWPNWSCNPGYLHNNYCWYEAGQGQNCSDVCSAQSGTQSSNCVEMAIDTDCQAIEHLFGSLDDCYDSCPVRYRQFDSVWVGYSCSEQNRYYADDGCEWSSPYNTRLCACKDAFFIVRFPFTASF